jgi:hypothetical protein
MLRRINFGACLSVLALSFFAGVLVWIMNLGRELPFGSTDDGPIHLLPLIQAQTDAWLDGRFLSIDWRLGSGWTPWEGVQAGVFYPPYLVANLMARLLGQPLAILDVSAALHLALAGLMAYWLTAGRLDRARRLLWSLLVIVQPAPIILGMNWHSYLSSYPWFVGLVLLLWRAARGYSAWNRRNRILLTVLFAAFFLSAHPQMFVLGAGLLVGWRLALGTDRAGGRDVLLMAVALVPLLIPVLFILHLSREAAPDWLAGRGDGAFLLRQAQSLTTWLTGLTVGNLVPTRLFRIWPGVSWTGIGMFFCPPLVLSVILAVRRRNGIWLGMVAVFGVLMSAATFPVVAGLGVGPLAGFRWTWKLSVFMAPLALAMVLAERDRHIGWRRVEVWGLGALIVLSAGVSFRALPFDIFPAGTREPGSGIAATRAETRRMMHAWGMNRDDRIGWVGRIRISTPRIAAPLHGLIGNAPLLVGLRSVHMFEPLENRGAAQAHDGYSTPWRITLDAAEYAADRGRHNRRFSELGVTWLVSPYPHAFEPDARRVFRDRNGLSAYGLPLPSLEEGFTFPWGVAADGRRVALVAEGGGALRTEVALDAPPTVPVGRPLKWTRLPTGQWRGVARLVEGYWFAAGVVMCAAAAWVLFVSNRCTREWLRPIRMS